MLRRVLLATAVLASTASALLAPVSAQAAVPPPVGGISSVVLNTATQRLQVSGWDYDPAHPTVQIAARIFVDGRYAGSGRTGLPSPALDRARHISGNHGFTFTMVWTARAPRTVALASTGATRTAPLVTLARSAVRVYAPSPGDRIVAIAKQFVGRAPYVDGGASPSGFDCSGYTQYSYAQARVASLPRTADQQRYAPGMRIISAATARPGDLVFYLSGNYVYHVAIYAGNGWQYAAATPQDGIRYQQVWSSDVLYGTDWH